MGVTLSEAPGLDRAGNSPSWAVGARAMPGEKFVATRVVALVLISEHLAVALHRDGIETASQGSTAKHTMFKGQRRITFNSQTTLNTPVVVHRAGPVHHCSKDEVLLFLEKFIQEKESIIDTQVPGASVLGAGEGEGEAASTAALLNVDTNLSSALAQLKRVQRDFKGLPPASMDIKPVRIAPAIAAADVEAETEAQEPAQHDADGNAVTTSATGGKKVTFD